MDSSYKLILCLVIAVLIADIIRLIAELLQ